MKMEYCIVISIGLFSCLRCPKTVENFVVHSRNAYYNGHIFHRVIKQFMIQTGDPLGMYLFELVHACIVKKPVNIAYVM
jgi:hypothetical protein